MPSALGFGMPDEMMEGPFSFLSEMLGSGIPGMDDDSKYFHLTSNESGPTLVCIHNPKQELVLELIKLRPENDNIKDVAELYDILCQILDGKEPDVSGARKEVKENFLEIVKGLRTAAAEQNHSLLTVEAAYDEQGSKLDKAVYTLRLTEVSNFAKLDGDDLLKAAIHKLATDEMFITPEVEKVRKAIQSLLAERKEELECEHNMTWIENDISDNVRRIEVLESDIRDAFDITEIPDDENELVELVKPKTMPVKEARVLLLAAIEEKAKAEAEAQTQIESKADTEEQSKTADQDESQESPAESVEVTAVKP
jgi:hypothetical protein